MKHLSGSFNNIAGFSSLGKAVGIKVSGKDFAILYSDKVCTTSAVYTQNLIQGAPLQVTKKHLADSTAQAVVINSGIANVATGQLGIKNADQTTLLVASELGINAEDVLLASTGVIGPQLPMEKISVGVKGIRSELGANDNDFAEAILTTDTKKKEICINSHGFTIAGCAKGSGMIAPNMATMLAFITTDAKLSGPELDASLLEAVNSSFNMMSVDMDTSTSDMVIAMAHGDVDVVLQEFQEDLTYVCQELAKMVARDGEGATKLIISQVYGAKTQSDASKVAKSIVTSNLVKTAIYGNDPNWGRLMMALGNSGAQAIIPDHITIRINDSLIVENGAAAPGYNGEKLRAVLATNEEVTITTELNQGSYSAEAYGCDMSEEYIKINAEYTS